MHTNRYYAEIKRITRSVAADPQALKFDLRWYDFDYLRQTMLNYLSAKQTTLPLSSAETQYRYHATVNTSDQSRVLDGCYIDPKFNQINTVLNLKQAALIDDQRPLPDLSTDFEAWIAPSRQREKQLEALGANLDATDLEKFSVYPHAGWPIVSLRYLETMLNAYAKVHPVSADQMTQIFGDELTQNYWPIDPDTRTFFRYVMAGGLWLPNLVTLLKENRDPEINHLVILWMQWFKHGKTFHSMEVEADAHVTIRQVKRLINLLQQRRFDVAAPLLLREFPGFWD
jgi:hypothetical protein